MASARPAASAGGPTELERIRATVTRHFPVYETRIGPQSLLLAVHADRTTLEREFDALRRELGDQGYVPLLRREAGEEFVEVVRRPKVSGRGLWVNLVLLAATLATTIFAGALIWLAFRGGLVLTATDAVDGTVFFALPIMAILGLHEFAHYWVARRRHLDASLPFFLPVPPPLPFGTFGAFVSIRDPFPDRKAMFDVSAAGPLAGFVASIPVALGGLYLSQHAPTVAANYCAPTILGLNYGHEIFMASLIWRGFALFFPGGGATLHPLALAGWVGILVTSINLLPIGALDGGRVFRSLFGERARYVSYAAAFALFALSIYYVGWFLFGVLVILMGLRNAPPLNDISPLGPRRYAVGAVVAAVLVAGFVVVPIQLPQGGIALTPQPIGYPPPPPGAIAATVPVGVDNQDPVAHAFLFDVAVVNVTIRSGSTTEYLNATEIAAWAEASTWSITFPGGSPIGLPNGTSSALPSADYLTIGATTAVVVTVGFANPSNSTAGGTVVGLVVAVTAQELCPPSGGGHATADLPVAPP